MPSPDPDDLQRFVVPAAEGAVLRKYFDGQPDEATLALLQTP
jgi:hypothetical protein